MKKKILISNDDGIYAPGILALYDALKDVGAVTVVAPAGEQSAVGHAITLSDPIKTKQIQHNGSFFGYAVGGTPADCVKLAVCALLPEKPDLIVSGINLGPNTGISVIYSGTVSAATEGTVLGIPSIAISLGSYQKPHWEVAARVARQIVRQVLRAGLPPDTLLNVNVPNLPAKKIKGYRVTRMGRSRFVEKFDRRTDPQGNVYYWMDGELELLGDEGETDIIAVREGYVSLTPIWFDLTHRDALPVFRAWNLAW
ncbi:MAG: 5'/3'-nucleotidase SurE [Verrucomicrobia bacterium]|nr:MAG: 5'/3'-nucleotidase SurE [Verrucomicrobiota bacterium]